MTEGNQGDEDDGKQRVLTAERARAVAVVGSLHQQLIYQVACLQETRYQQIIAEKELAEEEELLQLVQDNSVTADEGEAVATAHGFSLVIREQTPEHGLALDDKNLSLDSESPPLSPSSSKSNTPYVTPPDSPSMLRWRFFLPLPSLLITTGTQTVEVTGQSSQTETSQTQDDKTAVSERSEKGVNTEPPPAATPTFEAATNTAVVDVHDSSVNTELSVFELLQLVHEAENIQNLQEQHKAALKELNEEKSKRMVNEHLVQIIQSDLTEVRQHSVTETTTRLRLENEVADFKVRLAVKKKKCSAPNSSSSSSSSSSMLCSGGAGSLGGAVKGQGGKDQRARGDSSWNNAHGLFVSLTWHRVVHLQ